MLKKQELNQTAPALLTAAVDVLRAYGLVVQIEQEKPNIRGARVDALIKIQNGAQETRFLVEVKHLPTQATVAELAQRRAHEHGVLLAATYIPPHLAQQLREYRIPFVDTAGNAWIHGPGILIWVGGRKLQRQIQKALTPRAFATGGLQLIFTLLANPEWATLPTRELATRVGIANGTVAAALRDLEAQGFVLRFGKRKARKLRNRATLLNKWTEGYLQRLQPTLEVGRYVTDRGMDWWRTFDVAQHGALWGGEPAAAILTDFLTPGAITMYTDQPPGRLVVDLKLRRHQEGNVLIRRKFWNFDGEQARNVTPALLVYADLMGMNDARCIETAGRIKDQYLARLLED